MAKLVRCGLSKLRMRAPKLILPAGFLRHALRTRDPHILKNPKHGGIIAEKIRKTIAIKRLNVAQIFISVRSRYLSVVNLFCRQYVAPT